MSDLEDDSFARGVCLVQCVCDKCIHKYVFVYLHMHILHTACVHLSMCVYMHRNWVQLD